MTGSLATSSPTTETTDGLEVTTPDGPTASGPTDSGPTASRPTTTQAAASAETQLVDLTGPTSGLDFDAEDWRGYLQVFAEPHASAELVSFHEPGARAVKTTGRHTTDAQGVDWREVVLAGGRTGWLPAQVAEPSAGTQLDFTQLPCRTDGITTGEAVVAADPIGEVEPQVASVAQMWQARGPDCDRMALLFTKDSHDWAGDLLATVGGEIVLEAFGTWARLHIGGVEGTRFDADYDLGPSGEGVTAVAGRNPDGDLVIELFAPQRSTFAVTTFAEPARVFVDVVPSGEPVEPGEPVDGDAPVVAVALDASVVLVVDPAQGARLDADGTIVVDQLPATFRGYARWFEANGSVQLTAADHEPLAGRLSGPSVWTDEVGDFWGLTINDYVSAPGSFTFTLEEAPPEASLLFVGSCGANDPTPDLPNYREVPGGRFCNYDGVVVAVELPR